MTSRLPSLESAKKCVAEGDLKNAEIELLGLLREDPHATEALHILSKIYVRKQQFNDAIVTLERLRKLAPSVPKLYFELGNAYLAGGRLKDSVTAFQQGLAIDHRNPQAHNNLGIALRQNGAFQEAEAAFLSAINIDPELALPYRNLGELSRVRGDSRQALKYFDLITVYKGRRLGNLLLYIFLSHLMLNSIRKCTKSMPYPLSWLLKLFMSTLPA